MAYLHQNHPPEPEDLVFTRQLVGNAPFGEFYRESGSVAQMRDATRHLLGTPFVRPVRDDVDICPDALGGVPGEWLLPPEPRARGTLVYFHGGGYVRGCLELGRSNAADLAAASGLRCFSAGYRQAPEHPFPAAVDDALAVCQALAGRADALPMVLAGESAGGGIVLVTAMRLRDLGAPLPAGVLAISPFFDMTLSGESWTSNASKDVASYGMGRAMVDMYLGAADRRNPLASPLFGRFDGLPPLHITVGGHEVVYSETEALASRAGAAGVPVSLEVYEGMPHGFIKYRLHAATQGLARMAQWVKKVVES